MPQAKKIDGKMFAILSKPEQVTIAKASELLELLASVNAEHSVTLSNLLTDFAGASSNPIPIVKPVAE